MIESLHLGKDGGSVIKTQYTLLMEKMLVFNILSTYDNIPGIETPLFNKNEPIFRLTLRFDLDDTVQCHRF